MILLAAQNSITEGQIVISLIGAIISVLLIVVSFFLKNFIVKQETAIDAIKTELNTITSSIKSELNAVLVAISVNDEQTKNIASAYSEMMKNTKNRLDSQSAKIDHNTGDIITIKTNIINIKESIDEIKQNGCSYHNRIKAGL